MPSIEEELWPALPFNPNLEPPQIDPDLASPEELVLASAHAHYYHARQALDMIATSAYQARLAGVDHDTMRACELQAITDHEAERADEYDEVDLEPEPDETDEDYVEDDPDWVDEETAQIHRIEAEEAESD